METHWKKMEVRWSDLDANRHMANAAYMNFTSHARIDLLAKAGINMEILGKLELGPAILLEQFSFFKEVLPNQTIFLRSTVIGLSVDGSIYKFHHDFYNNEGQHLAHALVVGVWFDLKKRSITSLPTEMLTKMQGLTDPSKLEVLDKNTLKNLPARPNPLPKNELPC